MTRSLVLRGPGSGTMTRMATTNSDPRAGRCAGSEGLPAQLAFGLVLSLFLLLVPFVFRFRLSRRRKLRLALSARGLVPLLQVSVLRFLPLRHLRRVLPLARLRKLHLVPRLHLGAFGLVGAVQRRDRLLRGHALR